MTLDGTNLQIDQREPLWHLWTPKALMSIGALSILVFVIISLLISSRPDGSMADFYISIYESQEETGAGDVSFFDLFGQGKPVILNFWAGLCPPCKMEMPHLQELYDQYTDKVLIVGIDVGPFVGLGSIEDGKALLKDIGITYPVGTTFERDVMIDYKVTGLPSTYFFASDGKLLNVSRGLMDRDDLDSIFEELIGETKLRDSTSS